MKNFTFLLFVSVAFFANGCKDDPIPESCTGVHFEYEGSEDGPEQWGELCVGYAACDGQVQSPIDITGALPNSALSAISRTYTTSATHLLNNGHTVQFTYDAGSFVTMNGVEYQLLQFHLHTASEHHINGQSSPMEVHLVHKNEATGNLVVIGLLVEEGAENAVLQPFVGHLPDQADETYEAADTYNIADILLASEHYYTYSGSLTTPPCSEIVTWVVMKDPISASAAQISALEDIMHENNRPIQDLNDRAISEY